MLRILLTFIAFTSFAKAEEITIINNGSPTGVTSQVIPEYAKEFPEYKFNVKHTNGNCALSKILWDNAKGPSLLFIITNFDGSTDKNNPLCYIKTSKDNLLFVNHSSPKEFCSVGNKNWSDFIQPNSTHTVGISPTFTSNPEIFLNLISKHYGNTLKLVRLNSNSEFMTMAKSGELDFGFRPGLKGTFNEKCFWNSYDIDQKNLFPFLKDHKKIYNTLYEDSIIVYKNLTPEKVIDFQNRIHKAWNFETTKNFRNRRGYDDSLVYYSNEHEKHLLLDKFVNKLNYE